MQSQKIEVKGIKNGILVDIKDGDWHIQKAALLEHIDQNKGFFEGAKLVIDVGSKALKSPELSTLRNTLADHEIKLWAILSTSLVTERASQDLGLAIKIDQSSLAPEKDPINSLLDGDEAVFLKRTLRSGHKVKYPGHIVILGDVNPGAEIVAGGNIIVWGKLRGVVHAGAAGDTKAVVCSLDLSPTQLRIADKISISPTKKGKARPEIAQLEDGQVTAREWYKFTKE
ncbi:MAG: septum site-determining protein MinC [Anaerolineales bacterium]|nr:septum site-determining protein MinC [Anaerolineales bacterium]